MKKQHSIITGKNIIKNFGNGEVITKVLKGVNIEIYETEFIAITGKSGSGKSTLLYQLSLLDFPTKGEIIIDGTSTQNLSEAKRTHFRLTKMGYVFQNYALLPSLSALENILVPLKMQGIETEKAIQMAYNALKKVDLESRIHHKPNQLSGGQQQRASIARAIAHKPKILFADEPTANLDSLLSKSVYQTFLNLKKEGQTIVLVTHDEDFSCLADRNLILKDGQF